VPQCPNGHEVGLGDAYCSKCAAPVSELPLTEAPFSRSERTRSSSVNVLKSHPRSVVGILFVLVAVAVALIVLHLTAGESISYKDGYSAGYSQGQADAGAASPLGVNITCYADEGSVADGGGVPSGDNVSQWLAGCVAGYNAGLYSGNHPGSG
jgi:hypothetical protein